MQWDVPFMMPPEISHICIDWGQASIYTAELMAILQTLKYLSEISSHKEAIIITDCLSELNKFTNMQPGCDINHTEAGTLDTEVRFMEQRNVYTFLLDKSTHWY